jgi:NAD(P)-dependent dehydrogenase (short-subunit alcohol dehydrogenase family)
VEKGAGIPYIFKNSKVLSQIMSYMIHVEGKCILIAGGTDGIGERAAEALHENAAIAKVLPSRRLGTADDPASSFVFLASDASEYVNGTVIDVSGGLAGLQVTAAFGAQHLDTKPKGSP